MRKITFLSDLHTEFSPFDVGASDLKTTDYLVLAGDIGCGLGAKAMITKISQENPSLPIILVLGNHELYGVGVCAYDMWKEVAKEWQNIYVLQNSTATLDGLKFIGTTLWTDLTDEKTWAKQNISDYMRIPLWTTEDCTREHMLAVSFLEDELINTTDNSSTVVVTHHVPTFHGIPPQYVGHKGQRSFASNLDYLIDACQPALWIYGHTHGSMDFWMGKTRLVCNPRGYPRMNQSENVNFDPCGAVSIATVQGHAGAFQ